MLIRKEREPIYAQFQSLAMPDGNGNVNRLRMSIIDVTERNRAKEELLGRNVLLTAINRIFREMLICKTDEEVAKICLAVAEELTGSRFGFIAEVNYQGRLDSIALSDPGWDACRMPRSEAVAAINNIQIHRYWERVIHGQESVIVNDPVSHPEAIRTPEGHPEITSLMLTPLLDGDRVFGLIALGNKKMGYKEDDRKDVEAIATAISKALMGKRAENNVQMLSIQLLNAQESERRMISRELHDSVAQDLSAAKMECDTFFMRLEIPSELKEMLLKISGIIKQVILKVRDISYDLRPPDLAKGGIVQTLANYCSEFSEKTGIRTDFFSVGMENIELDELTRINAYRMIQEALNNVDKHAEASNVKITFSYTYPEILLRVIDNGKGFDVGGRMSTIGPEKRMGIMGMGERAKLLGGTMEIHSKPEHGTKIFIKLPYVRDKANA